MKLPILITALSVIYVSTFAQGTIEFANFGPGLAAKIEDTSGAPLAGIAFSVDLFWAPGIVTDSCALQPLNAPAVFSTNASLAGYFFGGTRTFPAAPGSTITAQLRVWGTAAGSSWVVAQCVLGGETGSSIVFQATLADQNSTNYLTGLNGNGFQLTFPVLTPSVWSVSDIVMLTNTVGFTIVPIGVVLNVVVEATTNLTNPVWTTVQFYDCIACPVFFSDSLTSSPTKFYRVRWFGWP